MSPSTQSVARPAPIPLRDLITGFLLIGLMGFGGIAQSAQYVMVERRKWMSAREFVELFGVCAVLPGGNIMNASIMLGDRDHGPLGALACGGALMLAPLAILICVALGYDHYAYLPDVQAATAAGASVAAGLILGTAARLARGVSLSVAAVLAGAATLGMVWWMRYPIWAVLVTVAPAAIAWSLYRARRP